MRLARTVQIGGASKEELLRRLATGAVQLNDYAHTLFADPRFTVLPTAVDLDVVAVSLLDLGLEDGAVFADILARAASRGLSPCPLELAVHLRLSMRQQEQGPYLTVASPPIAPDDVTTPAGLYLRHLEDGLWLRGFVASADHHYAPDFSAFVFQQSA